METAEAQRLERHLDRVLTGLRSFGADYAEFTRRFAASLGLHTTDAAALVEILYAEDREAPLSPARLAERIGLSSGATTALLNRLEAAGHITRSREHHDRRIVTLRSSPNVAEPARRFFGPLAEHLGAMLARYPEQRLVEFEAFLDDLDATMDGVLAAEARPR